MKGDLNESLLAPPSNNESLIKRQETLKTLSIRRVQSSNTELDPIIEIKKSLAVIQHGRTKEFTNKILCKHEFFDSINVSSVCFTPDSQYLLSTGYDKLIKVWNVKDKKLEFSLKGHTNTILIVKTTRDGKILVSGSEDKTVRIWDFVTRKAIFNIGLPGGIFKVQISPDDLFIAATCNANVHIINIKNQSVDFILKGHIENVKGISFSPDGVYLASAGCDKIIKVWTFADKSLAFELSGHKNIIWSLDFSFDSKFLVSGSDDTKIKVWSIENKSLDFTLAGHKQGVAIAKFSPDGKYIASGSDDQDIIIWDFKSKESKHLLKGHSNTVWGLAFNPEGLILASGSDTSIGMWDIETGKKIVMLESFGHKDIVKCVKFSHDGKFIASASNDKSVKIWRVQDYKMVCEFNEHEGNVLTLCYNHDSTILASGGSDSKIILWNLTEKKKIHKFKGHDGSIRSLTFSSDSSYLISGSNDTTVKVWDVTKKTIDTTFTNHKNEISAVAISSRDRYLASGCQGNIINIYNFRSRKFEFKLERHTNCITSLSFNKTTLVSGSDDKSIKIWSLEEKKEIFELSGHSNYLSSVCFSKDGKYIVSGSWDLTVKIWDVEERKEIFEIEAHDSNISCVDISPDKNYLLTSSESLSFKLWSIMFQKENLNIEASPNSVMTIKFSPLGNMLATGNKKGKISIFNKTFELMFHLEEHSDCVRNLVFNKDESKLYSTGDDNNILVWDLTEKKHVKKYTLDISSWSIDLSPDGNFLASGAGDKIVRIWDLSKEKLIKEMKGHKYNILSIQYSLNGYYLASGSRDKTIILWNSITYQKEYEFLGHTNTIWGICFSPNSKYLASGSRDKAIKIWNVEDKRLEFDLLGHKHIVTSLVFTLDSKFLISGSWDMTIIIWNIAEKRKDFELKSHESSILCLSIRNNTIASADDQGNVKIWDLKENITLDSLKFSESHMIEFNEQNEINNLYSLDTGLPDKTFTGEIIIKDPESFNPGLVYNSRFQDSLVYFNIIQCFEKGDLTCLSKDSWKILLPPHKFTVLHFLCYKGEVKALQSLMKISQLALIADNFGHSPIFYSVKSGNEKITDMILNRLIGLKDEMTDEFLASFYAIRNDMFEIIKSSSAELEDFLNICIYSKMSDPIFAVPLENLPFVKMMNSEHLNLTHFVKQEGNNSQPIKIKIVPFCLPTNIGSSSSIKFLNVLIDCKNKEIFRTETIKHFIENRWKLLRYWTLSYTILNFLNVVFLILFFMNPLLSYNYLGLVIINFILLLWESIQFADSGLSYFKESWNILDLIRLFFSILWGVLLIQGIKNKYLTWFTFCLNLLRGLSGFRSFDMTRYYIRLIFESFTSIIPFLIIFIYTTLFFGIINNATTHENFEINFKLLWIDSFSLIFGESDDMKSDTLDLKYITFLLAVVINVILMLNMIISILADSFDEFQLNSEIHDYYEKLQVIKEVEQIKSIFHPTNLMQFMHICVYAYEANANLWKGKVLDARLHLKYYANSIKNDYKKTAANYESSQKSNTDYITKKLGRFENKMNENKKNGDEKFETIEKSLTEAKDIQKGTEERIGAVEKKLETIEQKLDLLMNALVNKKD
ncbi:hypothetical protein SteCoe_25335 [Stentor coeruleus]|uniref:Ion transport domain-containing protein n=1 Tax=Stentor coeruleus TaxID=5963 RepID=A0A1R2BFK1_9CILI|nr:hypothetical protein SteCoe_25335 [Stentor coeruleus]